MSFKEDQTLRALSILAKLYAALEMSGTSCPFCKVKGGHGQECPVGIAWTVFNEEEREDARGVIRSAFKKAGATDADLDWPDLLHDSE